jgi:hydrogenase expression/formation protein HypC
MCLAVPGRIVTVTDEGAETRAGRVEFGGIEREVSLALLPEAKVGEYVLVHAGFAISLVDEEEAARVFEYLKEMDALSPDQP